MLPAGSSGYSYLPLTSGREVRVHDNILTNATSYNLTVVLSTTCVHQCLSCQVCFLRCRDHWSFKCVLLLAVILLVCSMMVNMLGIIGTLGSVLEPIL